MFRNRSDVGQRSPTSSSLRRHSLRAPSSHASTLGSFTPNSGSSQPRRKPPTRFSRRACRTAGRKSTRRWSPRPAAEHHVRGETSGGLRRWPAEGDRTRTSATRARARTDGGTGRRWGRKPGEKALQVAPTSPSRRASSSEEDTAKLTVLVRLVRRICRRRTCQNSGSRRGRRGRRGWVVRRCVHGLYAVDATGRDDHVMPGPRTGASARTSA